ncbi:MAG: hypothetical protein J6A76_00530 [Oscillospiraceae bacterium]|nr:hypothetical protein [Oscillospiraceae bacterium]
MEKFIPFEKLSKKKQRELNAKQRGSWYGINPVTRKPENSKAYNRKKAQKWSDDSVSVPFNFSLILRFTPQC